MTDRPYYLRTGSFPNHETALSAARQVIATDGVEVAVIPVESATAGMRTLADAAQAVVEARPLYAPPMAGVIAFAVGVAILDVVTEAWRAGE